MGPVVEAENRGRALLDDLLATSLRMLEGKLRELQGDREQIRRAVVDVLADVAEDILLAHPECGPALERKIGTMAATLEYMLHEVFRKKEQEASKAQEQRDAAIRKFCDKRDPETPHPDPLPMGEGIEKLPLPAGED